MRYFLSGLVLTSILLVSCASSQNNEYQGCSNFLEKFNRKMFEINYNVLDPYIMRSAAMIWRDYIPIPIRIGVSNFLGNLNEPAAMVNSFLRIDPYRGAIHFNRFFLNTVIGLGGVIDVARMANDKLERRELQRFGGTLGAWGVGYGPYLLLPGYGSFTIREDVGDYLDTLYPVLSWLNWPLTISKWALQSIEARSQLLDSDDILRNSIDPYTFLCNTYFQYHNFLSHGEKVNQKKNFNTQEIQENLNEIDADE